MNDKYEMTSMPPERNLHNQSIADGKTIRCRENPRDKGIKRARSRNTRPGLVCTLNIFMHLFSKVVLCCVFSAISSVNCTNGCYLSSYSSEDGNLATKPIIATRRNIREGSIVNK